MKNIKLENIYLGGGVNCYYYEFNKKVFVITSDEFFIDWFLVTSVSSIEEFVNVLENDDEEKNPFMPNNQSYDFDKLTKEEKECLEKFIDLVGKM